MIFGGKVTDRKRDRVSSLVIMVIGLGICLESIRLSLGDLHQPGPGMFPFLAGGILGILSLIVFLRSFKGNYKDEKQAFWLNPQRGLKVIWVLVALILYAIGMNYLGFSLSTVLFLGFFLRGIDPQRWLTVILVSIFGTAIAYAVFVYWLDIPMPEGILGL